jgi:hypothetical protein
LGSTQGRKRFVILRCARALVKQSPVIILVDTAQILE